MSLEQELARNTEAMIALTAAIAHSFPVVLNTKVVKAKVTPAEVEALKEVEPPKPVVVAATPPAALEASSEPVATVDTPAATAPPTTSPASVTSATTPTIEYAQVAAAIVATFKVDRVKTIAALAKFGASKGPQVKPEDYAAFLKELTT